MIRNFLVIALLASFAFAGTAYAESRRTNVSGSTSSETIDCVGAAVATREAALETAIKAHGTAVNSAYADRKSALASAYASGNTSQQVREKVQAAWKEFRADMKAAKKAWRDAHQAAWKEYRADVKECRASRDLTDERNAGADAKGD